MRRLIIGIALVLATTIPADAAWIFKGADSDFGDDGMSIAAAMEGGYLLGVRCSGSDVDLVYLTPEQDTEGVASKLSAFSPKLMLRIDKGDVQSLDVTAETLGDDDKLGFTADLTKDVVEQLAKAKSRISVVVEVLGQKYHEKRFGVSGSTKALASLKAKCPFFDGNKSESTGQN